MKIYFTSLKAFTQQGPSYQDNNRPFQLSPAALKKKRQAGFAPQLCSLTRAGLPLIEKSAFQSAALLLHTVPVSLGKTPHPGFFPRGSSTGV